MNNAEHISRDTHGCVMKWFQLSTQWAQTIADLGKYITSPISVTILEAPSTMYSNWQTPLDSSLMCVLEDYSKKDIQAIKRALQNVARARSNNQLEEFPGDWRKLTIEEWDKWAHNFTGKMHCEAMPCMLKENEFGQCTTYVEWTLDRAPSDC